MWECVREEIADCRAAVLQKVAVLKPTRCMVALQIDVWKPKMKTNWQHYATALVSWINEHWQWEEICIDCRTLPRPRNGEQYTNTMNRIGVLIDKVTWRITLLHQPLN